MVRQSEGPPCPSTTMGQRVAVIGAGPVGCLTALGLQQRGYKVVVFERQSEANFAPSFEHLTMQNDSNPLSSSAKSVPISKSINLAISMRGLTALEFIDPNLAKIVLDNSVPMSGRMIHHQNQQEDNDNEKHHSQNHVHLDSQRYSVKGDCINSVSRLLLSRLLLDQVVKQGIEVRWEHGVQTIDFSQENMVKIVFDHFKNDNTTANKEQREHSFNTVFGCDGHHSKVRSAMQAASGMRVWESKIDNYYIELHIPASIEEQSRKGSTSRTTRYALDPNHLHIWPRHEFMLIALANRDKSFTSTFFAPQRIFDKHLQDSQSAIAFFRKYFPDAIQFIGGEDAVSEQVCGRRPSMLGMIQCEAYHHGGSQAILLGDAAHAMVPFYGQGLNCGLEDVRVLFTLLDEEEAKRRTDSPSSSYGSRQNASNSATASAFARYSHIRKADLQAIQRLALDNYREMSSNVVRSSYLVRKRIDNILTSVLPQGWWASLYENVTFSNLGYASVRKREARQTIIVQTLASTIALGTLLASSFAVIRTFKYIRHSQ